MKFGWKIKAFFRLGFWVLVGWSGNLLVLVDWVIAEIVDRDGKSSLLSLVKAFDSVLAVYDGFCNLKQVPISHCDSLYLLILIVSFGG